jgi:hypothetical protein
MRIFSVLAFLPVATADVYSELVSQGGLCGPASGLSLRQNFTTRIGEGPGFVLEDSATPATVLATGQVLGLPSDRGANNSVVSQFEGGCMDSTEWWVMPCKCQAVSPPGAPLSTVSCTVLVQANGASYSGICTGVYHYTQV